MESNKETEGVMKRFCAILMVFFTLQGCEKRELAIPGENCFAVSYLMGICGQAVLKIQNPEFYHLGETWNGHENVFLTDFACEVDVSSILKGIFYVSISENFSLGECVRCAAAIDYTGSKNHPVNVLTNCIRPTDKL